MTVLERTGSQRQRQRGAALLLAMLIVSLVATLAGAMVWQQWRAIQVEAAERARVQAAWILGGALDWARLILREDSGTSDNLTEPWAVALSESRLSSFLAADKDGNGEDGPEAFLSGSISDAQGRYNLAKLVLNGQVQAAEVDVLKRLLDNIGVSPDLAIPIAAGLRDAGTVDAAAVAASAPSAPASGVLALPINPDPALMPQTVAQLRWLGIDPAVLRRMEDFVVLLPTRTRVNLNTAPREVIAAVIPGLDLAGAQRLVQARERTPFRTLPDVIAVLGSGFSLGNDQVDVVTSYFEVRGRLRLVDRILEEKSLVRRIQRDVTVLSRERVSSLDSLR